MVKSASVRSAKHTVRSSSSSTRGVAKSGDSSPRAEPTQKNEGDMVTYSLVDLAAMPDATDWDRLKSMTDEEIEAAVRDDPDAAPIADEDFWRNAKLVLPPPKELISIRVDKDVLDWFRSLGRGYQTRMNMVLRSFMEHQQKKPEA